MTSLDLPELLRQEGLCHPVTLTLAVTGQCNLNCSHCWVGAGAPASLPHLPSPAALAIIHEFAALGGRSIRFTGGELLLHPQWLTLLTSARQSRYDSISLQSNGILFTEKSAIALRELDFSGISIQISLDGATAASHDLVRGKGAFSKALRGISMLTNVGLGPRVTIFLTEMRHNLEEIPDLLELAEALGVAAVVTGALVRCGRASEQSRISPPDPEQYLRLLDRLANDQPFRRRYEEMGTTAAVEWRMNPTARQECCTFMKNPYLSPDGVLYPCTLCHAKDFSVSEVFKNGLVAAFREAVPLWSSLMQISRHRSKALPECQNCPEQAACAGGCMGRAWGSHGNLLTADDRCEVRKAVG